MEKKVAVFALLKQTNHDFTSAEQYGDIDILFPLGVNVVNVDVIADAARRWFHEFDFQDDYFLPVGNPVVVAVVSMCLIEEAIAMQVDSINILEWDNKDRSYVEREFTPSDWED